MKSSTKKYAALTVLAALVMFGYIYYVEGTLPVDRSHPQQKVFVIHKGQTLNAIISDLEREKLIRNKIVFFLLVKQMGIEKNIQAGDFRLSTDMTPQQLAKKLTQGTLDTWVTVIEGLRREQIADIFAQEVGIQETDFLSNAQEGYLFPDTYLIPREASSDTILSIMSANFKSKYTPQMQAAASRLGLTQQEYVTMASIVEKEGRGSDRPLIASILLRRLKENYPLQADATVQYALGYDRTTKKWWRSNLSLDDLKINSPYNTYKQAGLPPAPICSPGLQSLEAVAQADPSTPYFFYIHDKQGRVHPAKNDQEHQANINKYLQ